MKYDSIVIGSGISGITTAITLAQQGRHVAIIEKAERLAPVLRGFSRRGVHFDTGFHYSGGLAPGEALDVFFRYLGVSKHIESFPFNEDKFDVVRYESSGLELNFPVGYDKLQERLSEIFPSEGVAISSYIKRVRTTCDAMPYINLDVHENSGLFLQRVMGETLQETLDSLTNNGLLKSFLSTHCLLYGVPPHEVSFAQHAAVVGTYYQSVRGIRGGGLALVKACETRLVELGVDTLCSCEAEEITICPKGTVTGVRLKNGSQFTCNEIISTIHPRLLLGLLPEGAVRPAYSKRLRTLSDTVSAFICFATTKDPLTWLEASNKFLLPDTECFTDLGERAIGNAPLFLIGAHRSGENTPCGFIGISPASYSEMDGWESSRFGKRPLDYLAYKELNLNRIQNQIEQAYPDLAGKIEYIEGATPLTIRDYCCTPLGGLYGVKHMAGQFNPHSITKIPGLFLAGQAVVAPGVMGATLSGLLTCGTILGHDLIRKGLKACC